MGTETFVNYWIGQEPTPPSPNLQEMPPWVDVVPLAFVKISPAYELEFGFLCTTHTEAQLKREIQKIRMNGTKVLFSILDERINRVPDVEAFVANVARCAVEWGVDGVDLDYEPFEPNGTLMAVTQALRPALRKALGTEPLMTSPIWSPWLGEPEFLRAFVAELDFVTTMDYAEAEESIDLCQQYMDIIGTPEKVAIGTICMGPPPPGPGRLNSLEDVAKMCTWEPASGRKRGAMLYTFSYDVTTRAKGGTGQPNGAYTKTIRANLP